MYEVKSAQVEGLFQGFPYDPVMLRGALSDQNSRVFVDDPAVPATALICSPTGIGFLFGSSENAACALLAEVLAIVEQPPVIRFVSLPVPAWAQAIRAQYGYRFTVAERVSFSFDVQEWQHQASLLPPLPNDVVIRQIDQELAPRIAGEIDPDFATAWPDPSRFPVESLGFCVMRGNRIVSVAYSAYPLTDQVEIGVATVPDMRGRQYCSHACRPLIAYCLEHRITPHWSTHAINSPSRRSAAKVGFTKEICHNWVQYTPWNANRTACQLAEPVLESFAGEYRLENGASIFITHEDQQLQLQFFSRWRAKFTLGVESATSLFLQEDDIQFILQTTRQGQAETLIFRNGGNDRVMTRVGMESTS